MAPVRGMTDAAYRTAFAQCFGGFVRAYEFSKLRPLLNSYTVGSHPAQ